MPDPKISSDRLAAAQAGSTEALGELLQAYRAYLLSLAQGNLDNDLAGKGGASDIVQETFLEAQNDFRAFHGKCEEELLAWLRRLLLNNVANFKRRYRLTAKRAVRHEVALDGLPGCPDAAGVAANISSPSGQAMAHEQTAMLEAALARLPGDHREVLLLRYQEQLSFEEIAVRMDRSSNAVRKLWGRAIRALQQEFDTPP